MQSQQAAPVAPEKVRMAVTRATNHVLLLLCAMYFITYVDRVNVSTAAEAFGLEFGLSKTQLGFVFSAFAYPYLVFQIIGGWLGDRFGPRKTLTICAAIWAGSTILTGLVGGFVSLIAARVLLGLGKGRHFPLQPAPCPSGRVRPSGLLLKVSPMRLPASAMP